MYNQFDYRNTRYPPVSPDIAQRTANAPQPLKRKKNKTGPGWGGIIALCLCCSLVFGTGGAVIGAGLISGSAILPETQDGMQILEPAKPVANNQTTEYTLNALYQAACPSVVGITIEGMSVNIFGQRTQLAASGSGFILSEDGYIVTNSHVVDKASSVKVTLYSGQSYDAQIIGSDSETDIALLKINAGGLKPVVIGNSKDVYVGQSVAAIGNPLGELTYTLTDGIISALDREINVDGAMFNMLQTNTAINPGNSGGPLFNMYGDVIGITTAKYSESGTNTIEGIGFAIPIDDAMEIITALKLNGYVTGRPMLGISGRDVGGVYGRNGIIPAGVYVTAVEPGSGAEKAGIRPGDIITELGGTQITSMADISSVKKNYKAGDTVMVKITRGDDTMTFNLTFDEQKVSE